MPQFDNISIEDLVLDMETRFFNGEIKNLMQYVDLLKVNLSHTARMKVYREHALFERSISYCLIENEKNV